MIEGDALRYRAPKGAMDDALKATLAARKVEVAELLRAGGRSSAVRLFSRLIGEEVWLVDTDADARAFEAELQAEGDQRPVFSVAEMMRLADMAVADQKTACAALAR